MKHISILLLGLMAIACAPTGDKSDDNVPAPTGTVIATVDGQPIYDEMMDFYRKARFGDRETTDDENELILNDLTQLYAMVEEAKRQGIDQDPDISMRIKMQGMSLMAQRVMQQFREDNPITDEQVQAAFETSENDNEFKARHILVKEESEAVDLINQLDAGADFATLAEEFSTGPSASRGGDLGWFPAAQMVKPFGDALPGIEPGNYGKTPVQTQFGWHVILVEDTRAVPFESVSDKLREQLATDQVNDFLESVKAKAQIVDKRT
ncbi:MAG: peptidylprolyl isomerase [Pseudomonadota bacterium]